jgi:hypothetical protein
MPCRFTAGAGTAVERDWDMRTLLTLALGAVIGAGIAAAILYFGAKAGSVTIAVISACVVVWYAVKAVRTDREKMRRGRDDVWQRRITDEFTGALWIPRPDDDYPDDDYLGNAAAPGSALVLNIRDGMSHDEFAMYRDRRWRPIKTIKPGERHGL